MRGANKVGESMAGREWTEVGWGGVGCGSRAEEGDVLINVMPPIPYKLDNMC